MTIETIRKSITVKASVERAFNVFTSGIDTWWPRTHHIGGAPMAKTILEPRLGGRCLTEHTDGTTSFWGQVLVWEPPHRFVIAWQVTPAWKYEPDLEKSSEVEVSFHPGAGNTTNVELEHRHFERYGEAAAAVRSAFDSPEAWQRVLDLFRVQTETTNSEAETVNR